jgi:hypothetical protein
VRISSQPDICSPISISSTGMGLGRLALVVSPLRAFYGSTAGPTIMHTCTHDTCTGRYTVGCGYGYSSWIVLDLDLADCLSVMSDQIYRRPEPSRYHGIT